MTTLTVTSRWQVTLRREFLRHLGVGPGGRIEVTAAPGNKVTLSAARPTGSIEDFIGGGAGKSDQTVGLEEIQAAIAAGWAGEVGG